MIPFAVPKWVWTALLYAGIAYGAYLAVQRVRAWHSAYFELPVVTAQLEAERTCAVGSTCDLKATERANLAAAQAAQAASDAVAQALAGEEAARREAAEWRSRFRSAQAASPACAAWAAQSVGCPL
jgi:hypothetical protein